MRVTGEAGGQRFLTLGALPRGTTFKAQGRGQRSAPPGSADVPVGSNFSPISRPDVLKPNAQLHPPSRGTLYAARRCVPRRVALPGPREGRRFAARVGVLLHGAWRPRARSEVRCGWGVAVGLRTLSLQMRGG